MKKGREEVMKNEDVSKLITGAFISLVDSKKLVLTRICIGIDPDSVKSGVAVWDSKEKKLIGYTMLRFFELFDWLKTYDLRFNPAKVILEAGWLARKSNWHNEKQGARIASRIGKNVGANHQTGKLIAEMCNYLKISYQLVMPQGKVDAKNFERITGIKKSNQDVRDAVMLVLNR